MHQNCLLSDIKTSQNASEISISLVPSIASPAKYPLLGFAVLGPLAMFMVAHAAIT